MIEKARSDVKSVSIQAVKITADGQRIPLGTVAYYHRNPLKRILFRIKKALGV
jgi:hypothetical protein